MTEQKKSDAFLAEYLTLHERNKARKPETVNHIKNHCPHCLEILHENWKFCANCGQRIDWGVKP